MILKSIVRCPLPPTLRNPSGCSVLSHSDNTACTAHFVRPNFGFAETSYMLETLNFPLPNLKCTPINLQELRGH